MKTTVSRLPFLVAAIAMLSAAHAAETPKLAWRLPPCARIDGPPPLPPLRFPQFREVSLFFKHHGSLTEDLVNPF